MKRFSPPASFNSRSAATSNASPSRSVVRSSRGTTRGRYHSHDGQQDNEIITPVCGEGLLPFAIQGIEALVRVSTRSAMQHEPTGRTTISDEALVAALIELKDSDGAKQYVRCRFGFSIASTLVSLGLASIDNEPTHRATMRITLRGRTVLDDR